MPRNDAASAMLAFALLLTAAPSPAAEIKSIAPPGAQIVGPYNPGLLAGKFLYVSGQGAKAPDGHLPDTVTGQVRQCLDNVKAIVEAAGLTMDHAVYAQLYLSDPASYTEALQEWDRYFQNGGPARATLGVARLPAGTPLEITVVAVTDVSQKKVIRLASKPVSGPPDAVAAAGRLYVSGCPGLDGAGKAPDSPAAQTQLALDHMGSVLKAAGIGFEHMVFVNPYLTDKIPYEEMNQVYAKHFEFGNTPARATIGVAHLPGGANIEFTGVAVMNLSDRRAVRPKNMPPSPTASPCVLAGDTLFCSAKSGFIPGPSSGIYTESVENQVRQTMRNLLDGLEEAGMDFSGVLATNVYLDDIQDFPRMNRIYAMYFKQPYPTRTTVQQHVPAERKANEKEQWPTLEQISLIAVR